MERQRRKDPSKNLLECLVGDVRYGIAIQVVREIVNPLPVVPLAGVPPYIPGVADYREEVVPVVDMRVRFGLVPHDTRRTKWVVVRTGEVSFALVVDAVTEVFRSSEIKPAPALAAGADVRSLEGVASHEGELVLVFDTARLATLVEPVVTRPASVEAGSAPPLEEES